jgi:mannan endo-1,4-beta-mannosidase
VASGIISSDPLHNIIFSAHAYWYGYALNDSAIMRQIMDTAVSYNYPLLLGEVANYQDSTPAYCTWSLNYPALLNICTRLNVGWLVWSWNNDNCNLRQLSTDGTYANLSPYGMDIVNNTIYGLHTAAKLTTYLADGACITISTGLPGVESKLSFQIYPNPSSELINIHTVLINYDLSVSDVCGHIIFSQKEVPKSDFTLFVSKYQTGIYFLTLRNSEGSVTKPFAVVR